MKIDKHLFMVNQPSYPAETESDDYYFNVANRLAEASARVEGIGRWNEAVVARAAVYVVGYYQDVISDAGVWRGFISECRRLYGRTLPFYDTGEEYVDFELNPEDVRFMVWYSLSMLDESRRDLSPLDSFVERLAERWYSILEEGYEEAPLPDEFNIAHGLEVHDPEDAEKLMHLGDWLYKRCWLLAPANTLNMQELVAQLPQKDPGSDEVRNKLKELLDHAINELPTGPLALYLREWVWLTVADRMPPKGRLPKEEGEDHKYYGPFMEATGGERIAFFATYEELNRFFIEALGWTQGEKHLAQLEKESDFVPLDLLPCCGGPVAQKRGLQPCDPGPLYPEMGVAPPFAAPVAPVDAQHVAVGDVHSSDESHPAVDDRDLAVVAVVDLAGEKRELHVQERVHLDSLGSHPLEKGFFYPGAAHVVVENPHLDPLAGFGDEGVAQAAAGRVVAEDVVLDMDVVAGRGDRFEQGLDLRSAVGVGGQLAAEERDGQSRAVQQPDQRQPLRRDVRAACGVVFFQPHGDASAGAVRDDAALGEILTEEEVGHQPCDRRQHQHQYPRQGLQRIAVVGDDDQHHADDRQRVERQKQGGCWL